MFVSIEFSKHFQSAQIANTKQKRERVMLWNFLIAIYYLISIKNLTC